LWFLVMGREQGVRGGMRRSPRSVSAYSAFRSIYRVDEMLLDIGHQETLVQVTQTLRDGTRAMERMNRLLMSAGDLESTMQDAAESRERHRELAAVLRGDAGTSAGETGAGLDMHDDFHVSDAELEALRERIAREGPTTGHMSLTSGTKTCSTGTTVVKATTNHFWRSVQCEQRLRIPRVG
jgi:hypothetical protein